MYEYVGVRLDRVHYVHIWSSSWRFLSPKLFSSGSRAIMRPGPGLGARFASSSDQHWGRDAELWRDLRGDCIL